MRIRTISKKEEYKNSTALTEGVVIDTQKEVKNIKKFLKPQKNGLFLKAGEFKSPNYVKNRRGWKIDSNGNAYFKSVVAGSYIQVFVQATVPTSIHVNDIWYNTNDSNKPYRAAKIGATTIANGEWEAINNPTEWADIKDSALTKPENNADVTANHTAYDTYNVDGKPSSGFSTVVDDGVAPANPTGLTATAGIQGTFLQWTYNTETDMSHYEIWRNTSDDNSTATKIGQIKTNLYWDSGLTAGTTYYYWIKAVDHLGNISGFNATAGISATPKNVGETDIDDNAITAAKINVINLSAINADLGAITAGTITLPTTGWIKGGQTDYNTGTGFFLGYSNNDYKFSIGDPNEDHLLWDGSKLKLKGAGMENKAGDTVLVAAQTSKVSHASTTPVKFLEFMVGARGGLRIKYQAAIASDDVGYVRIYKNDEPIGSTHQLNYNGDATYLTDDIDGWELGDLLQIYGWSRDGTEEVSLYAYSDSFAEGKIAAVYNDEWKETAY